VTGDILLYWGPCKHVTEDGICTYLTRQGKQNRRMEKNRNEGSIINCFIKDVQSKLELLFLTLRFIPQLFGNMSVFFSDVKGVGSYYFGPVWNSYPLHFPVTATSSLKCVHQIRILPPPFPSRIRKQVQFGKVVV